jgi:hypothetical protein
MKNTVKVLGFALLSLSMVFTSCDKEEDENPAVGEELTTNDVTLSRKTDYGEDWVYYSFESKKELTGIDQSNYKTLDTWDIAFNRYNVRTNGGESGIGQAEVYDAGKVDWESITIAPEDGYMVDDTLLIVETFDNERNPIYMSATGNDLFKGVVYMSGMGATGPTYAYNDHIYVMKTAKGKYVKIWINSYFDAEGNSGYINFRYTLNNKGNKTFK